MGVRSFSLAVLVWSQLLIGCVGSRMEGGMVPQHPARISLALNSSNSSPRLSRRTEDGQMDCFDALIYSDVDYNRQVNKTEYITFLELYGPPEFLPPETEDFNDLPLVLKSNFLILACLCLQREGADPNCCVGDSAYISNLGAAPDETPTAAEQIALMQVCYLTETSIDRYVSSFPPSAAPVGAPTVETLPTSMPVVAPTSASPTLAPNSAPTVGPTFLPTPSSSGGATPPPTTGAPASPTTTAPAGTPSPAPVTSPPAALPTSMPMSYPPASPTSMPSSGGVNTTGSPTGLPSNETTFPPTNAPAVDAVAQTTYIIAVTQVNGVPAQPSEYESDLRQAMDRLAVIVATNFTFPESRRLHQQPQLRAAPVVHHTRRLENIYVALPTFVDGLIATVCPASVVNEDRCEDVSASIGLYLDGFGDLVNVTEVKLAYEVELKAAIDRGALQAHLDLVNPDSPVYIVTPDDSGGNGGPTESPTGADDDADSVNRDPDNSDGLSGGAISGIVVGGMAGILLAIGLMSRRRQQNNDTEEYFLKENQGNEIEDDIMASDVDKGSDDGDVYSSSPPVVTQPTEDTNLTNAGAVAAVGAGVVAVGAAALAVKSHSPPPSPKDLKETRKIDSTAAVAAHSAERDREKQDSDAGSSGWSSREGMSSVESGADDDTTRASSRNGAASTAASAAQSETLASSSAPEDSDPGLQLTYSELDQAIQKGDWAAVGVTAALLASQSHDTSVDSRDNKKVNFQRDISNTRAAELDRLVEAGDWAGVVAAAAKYDASETVQGSASSVKSESRASEAGSSAGSVNSGYSGSGTALTAGSGPFTSGGTTNSDTNSRVKKLDEIRAEVEHLVEKVVPEEKDNIDEMLLQFRGREEELVETLRTMQEREVAQKARLEGQKRAKRDARQKVEQNKQTPASAIDNTGEPADDNWIREIDNTPSDDADLDAPGVEAAGSSGLGSGTSQEEDKRIEVEMDFKAMQDSLKAAIDSEDWEKVAEAAAGLSGRFSDNDAVSTASTNQSDRSLNSLVDKGDWDGVVRVAGKRAERDISTSADSEAEVRRARREQRLKEEREALAQADIWKAIAEQTKKDTAVSESEASRAATVAADWAIARSLSELQAAEKEGGDDAAKSDASDSGDDEKDRTI